MASQIQPPPWGRALTGEDYAKLHSSWISRDAADEAMLRRIDGPEAQEVIGQKGSRDCQGILIPYYWAGESHPFNYRVRRDHPDWVVGRDGKLKPERRYLGPPKGGNRLYVPRGVTLEQLQDCVKTLIIVEGEKKAIALWRLARLGTIEPRFIPIAIAGVWNWRGVVGKAVSSSGERIDVRGVIPDLSRIVWEGRRTILLFDSNVQNNESVKWARKGISRELASRGAEVQFVNLPTDAGVNGVDDLLAAAGWGPDRVLELLDKPVPGLKRELSVPPQYRSTPDGIFRSVLKGGELLETQLTNFQARIKSEITLDDGVETKKEFEVEAELLGHRHVFAIPATELVQLEWAVERMGSAAIIFSIHIAGASGAFKTERAALEQQHFGLTMNRLNLPGAWSSTSNALEVLAFHAKDSLLVVDDFAPQGNVSEVSRYHAAADRIFRAVGIRSGLTLHHSFVQQTLAKLPAEIVEPSACGASTI